MSDNSDTRRGTRIQELCPSLRHSALASAHWYWAPDTLNRRLGTCSPYSLQVAPPERRNLERRRLVLAEPSAKLPPVSRCRCPTALPKFLRDPRSQATARNDNCRGLSSTPLHSA